jgi:thiamine pyrophosphokinase
VVFYFPERSIMAVLVFANGDITELDWIRPLLAGAEAIIAADGGSRHLWALGQAPDLVIGDLDSLPDEVQAWLEDCEVTIHGHPPEKDETDLELALVHAVANYEDEIWLFGALGGRLDQTLANMLLLAHPDLLDKPVLLVNQHERAWLVTGQTSIRGKAGDLVSLIPLGGDVQVQATTGLQWSLQNERLRFGPARGVSNVMTADLATVTVRSGLLLCIHMDHTWHR